MYSLLQIVGVVTVLAFFFWLLMGGSRSTGKASMAGDELIDPDDSRQLATLVGMTGGDITDVAVVRFAIQRFQEQYGRRPSTRDIAILVGIMRTL